MKRSPNNKAVAHNSYAYKHLSGFTIMRCYIGKLANAYIRHTHSVGVMRANMLYHPSICCWPHLSQHACVLILRTLYWCTPSKCWLHKHSILTMLQSMVLCMPSVRHSCACVHVQSMVLCMPSICLHPSTVCMHAWFCMPAAACGT